MSKKSTSSPPSSDFLEVVEFNTDEYRLRWWLPEDDDYGAVVGEGGRLPTKKCKTIEDIESYTAEAVAFRLLKAKPDSDVFGLDSQGFWWATKPAAASVLRQISSETQTAIKFASESKEGWPEWAVTALNAGWKPPKGWKP